MTYKEIQGMKRNMTKKEQKRKKNDKIGMKRNECRGKIEETFFLSFSFS